MSAPSKSDRRVPPLRCADVNAVVGGLLRDLAFAQTRQRMFGYKRPAAVVLGLEVSLAV